MRFQSSLLVLGLIMTSLGISRAAPVRKMVPKGTTSFTSKAQRFAVWLPAKPTHGASISFSDGRPHTERYAVVWPKFGRRIIANEVSFAIYTTALSSNEPFSRAVAQNNLKEMAKGYLHTNKVGSAFTGEIIEQAGFPGRDLLFSSKLIGHEGRSERMRLFETARWRYTLSISGSVAAMKKHSGIVNRVLDSFRILPQ